MSAICPLKVQKLAEKRNNQFLVSCRKTALLCDFWNISKLCKMRGGIFDSRTGHHQHLLTFGLTKPIVSFLFCLKITLVLCLFFIAKQQGSRCCSKSLISVTAEVLILKFLHLVSRGYETPALFVVFQSFL